MIRLTIKIDYDEAREELEGFMQGNAMASFVHLHFGSNPTVAPAFVECCRYYLQGNIVIFMHTFWSYKILDNNFTYILLVAY